MFSLILDGEQARLSRGRVAAFTQGGYPGDGGGFVSGWSGRYGQSTFFDPETFTLFLEPTAFRPEWITSSAAPYAKYAPGDFVFSDSSNWFPHAYSSGLTYFDYQGTTYPANGITTVAADRNRGLWISWFNHGAGSGANAVAIELGWNNGGVGSVGPSFRIYLDGGLEFWKDGVKQSETYSLAGTSGKAMPSDAYVSVILLPARGREWLILASTGAAINIIDETIDPAETDPEVAPAQKIWFGFPTMQPTVLLAPVTFPAEGWRASKLVGIAADTTGQEQNAPQITWEKADPSQVDADVELTLVKTDGATAYAAPETQARLRFLLKSPTGGAYTPFVHAGLIDFKAEMADTTATATPIELADVDAGIEDVAATEVRLSVPDNPSGVTLNVTIRNPEAAETAGASRIRTIGNRPLQAFYGGVMFHDGRTDSPSSSIAPWDEAEPLFWESRDNWKALEQVPFLDPMPLDGLQFKAALLRVLEAAGIQEIDTDIFDDPYTLELGASPSTGQWATLVEQGDGGTVAEWVRRLMENYAGDWYYGFRPTASGIKFYAHPPSTFVDAGSLLTRYGKVADAITAGFATFPSRAVFREFQRKRLEPEANEIRVTGWDPRLQRPFVVSWTDEDAADPTSSPASRTENWTGDKRTVGYFEPTITTDDAAERMIRRLVPRLAAVRDLVSWGCPLLMIENVPLWRGDVVTLDGEGDYHIHTIECDFRLTGDLAVDSHVQMIAKYTGEKVISA